MKLAWIALVLAACTQPRSPRCKQICAREYECTTQLKASVPFDEKECVAACAVLEADQDNVAKVQQHADCVQSHQDCGDVLKCP
ncbi:MAG TPA: hypothetical protein VMJ10_01610 [Kofleriaceae bacterium]|nr:hypothetical protein [Kofleriaceae bacterium]